MRYPLLLKPVTKDYLWGGTRLKTEYGFESDQDKVAEGWMLACHRDGVNVVQNGQHAGKRLDDVLAAWGYTEPFPLLIKLIDAQDRLSVQVHPDDAYALEHEGEFGKTEMWYVVDCEEGATLAYGFTRELSRDELRERIENDTLHEVIRYVPVKAGDALFIPAGTLHAIGKGILIAEVQQNSNTTYRVSAYGRVGADGKPRELHVDKAVDVMRLTPSSLDEDTAAVSCDYGVERVLADCPYFKAVKLDLNGEKTLDVTAGFVSALVLSGSASLVSETETLSLGKGDSVFVPALCSVRLCGNAEVLLSFPM